MDTLNDVTNGKAKPGAPVPPHVPVDRVVDFDMYNPTGIEEGLQEAWKRLQAPGVPDLVWTPHNGGHWIATRGDLIKSMFHDHAHFSSKCPFLPREAGDQYVFIPTSLDPPEQRPYRKVLNDAIGPAVVRRIESDIRAVAVEIMESVREKGKCDFTREYAGQFPVKVFLMLVDLPFKDAGYLKYIADQMTRPDGSMTLGEATEKFFEYLSPVIDQRLESPGNDAISIVVHSQIEGRPITKDEALKICGLILLAGLDTVVNFLSFAMQFLAQNPEHRKELTNHPEQLHAATEELLRRFALVADARVIKRAIVVDGVELKEDDMVLLPTALYGLDDRKRECPMHVDFKKGDESSHITFGHGVHRCAGAHLARLEIHITLREWLARIPDFELSQGAELRCYSGIVGSMEALPLVWDPSTTAKTD